MLSFTKLFTLAALAAVSSAAALSAAARIAGHAHCSGGKVAHNATIDVGGGRNVHFTSMSCAKNTVSRRDLWDSPPLCILLGTCRPPAPPPATPPKNVCGVSCTNTCNEDAGNLPPITEDCQAIKDAIQIFQGQQSDTFVVQANHVEALTYGTCSYFFSNTGNKDLEYCWSALRTTASTAGSACFPPVMPLHSEGLCSGSDGNWAVGAAHS